MAKYGSPVYWFAQEKLISIESNQTRHYLSKLYTKLVLKYEPYGNVGNGRIETNQSQYGIVAGLKRLNNKARQYKYFATLKEHGLLASENDKIVVLVEPTIIPKAKSTPKNTTVVAAPNISNSSIMIRERSDNDSEAYQLALHRRDTIHAMIPKIRDALHKKLIETKASKEEFNRLFQYNGYARAFCEHLYDNKQLNHICKLDNQMMQSILDYIISGKAERCYIEEEVV